MSKDVLDREIVKVKDPLQANARGAGFLAAVGSGWIGFEDIPGLVSHEKTYHPDPANRRIYDELYGAFLRIYRRNRGIYRRLNRIRRG